MYGGGVITNEAFGAKPTPPEIPPLAPPSMESDAPEPELCPPVSAKVRSERINTREVVAAALAAGRTCVEAAAAGGINEKTARRWMKEPAFAARVDGLRKEMVTTAVAKLSSAMAGAADELTKLTKDGSPKIRLAAAKAILELALKVMAEAELREQLEELESRITELSK